MRSSVSKSAWEGARGLQSPVSGLQKAAQANTHQQVGAFLTVSQV